MPTPDSAALAGRILEEEEVLSLERLSQLCGARASQLLAFVEEGVLEVLSPAPPRFAGTALRRARLAVRLQRDLELNTAGVALVIELLERIEVLERRLGG
ncbi:MAG TPA: chaperone modulator CbpM [Steroidobacteraceae bacterium]|nr:chaperone modulator CbpM [Steroidobacteraceae bacterium]